MIRITVKCKYANGLLKISLQNFIILDIIEFEII
jgi:hypothetical protein